MLATLGHAGLGVAAGMVLAVGVNRLVAHLLVDVSAHDPLTLVTVGMLVMLAAAAAAVFPALRAAGVDPASALRSDL
jgi:ABC-type lipoprotein release transport system permease subunit